MKIYFVRDKHLQLKKLFYYLSNSLALLIPKFIFRILLSREISKVNNFNKSYIKKRLKYYIGLTNDFSISSEALTVNDLWANQLIVFYENVVLLALELIFQKFRCISWFLFVDGHFENSSFYCMGLQFLRICLYFR